MVQERVVLSFILLVGPIVVPGYQSVKQWSDGSPMPIPKPTAIGNLVMDGSPMPIPKPTGAVNLLADGSPMPIPKPTALAADGSPMPISKPTGVIERDLRTF